MVKTLRIVTDRLTLAPLVPDDAERMFAYRSDPDVGRYQSWVPGSVSEVSAFIDRLQGVAFDKPGTWFQLGIRLSGSGLLVGDIGVHVPDGEPRQAEIGFTVAPDHQGRGVAAEAVTGTLAHLFAACGKHRVFASVDPRNAPSTALLARVGMREEAHFRESIWFKGAWADDVVFAILESEWSDHVG
jgi:RimJ/RimL family protein N-acetyltransferase